jgi:hypothetical protein
MEGIEVLQRIKEMMNISGYRGDGGRDVKTAVRAMQTNEIRQAFDVETPREWSHIERRSKEVLYLRSEVEGYTLCGYRRRDEKWSRS